MTDDELLARRRVEYDTPYMALSVAKKMRTQRAKHAHLREEAARRTEQAPQAAQDRLQRLVSHPEWGTNEC